MEKHNFKPGDWVTVISAAYNGKLIVEGRAKIVKPLFEEDTYVVRFLGKPDTFDRYVDPRAQENPEAYIAKLNGQAGFK